MVGLRKLESVSLDIGPWQDLDPTPRQVVHIRTPPGDPDGVECYYSPPHTPPPLLPMEISLEAFDPLSHAQRLLSRNPSIKAVTYEVDGPRKQGKRLVHLERKESGEVAVDYKRLYVWSIFSSRFAVVQCQCYQTCAIVDVKGPMNVLTDVRRRISLVGEMACCP